MTVEWEDGTITSNEKTDRLTLVSSRAPPPPLPLPVTKSGKGSGRPRTVPKAEKAGGEGEDARASEGKPHRKLARAPSQDTQSVAKKRRRRLWQFLDQLGLHEHIDSLDREQMSVGVMVDAIADRTGGKQRWLGQNLMELLEDRADVQRIMASAFELSQARYAM